MTVYIKGLNIDSSCYALGTHLLWSVFLKPESPVLLILCDLVKKVIELRQLAHLHQVEPRDVQHPTEGFGLHCLQVQGSTTLNKEKEIKCHHF